LGVTLLDAVDVLAGAWAVTAASVGVLIEARVDFMVGVEIARVFTDAITNVVTDVGVGVLTGDVVGAVVTASELAMSTSLEDRLLFC